MMARIAGSKAMKGTNSAQAFSQSPRTPVERVRQQLILDHLDEVHTLDPQLRRPHRRITGAVQDHHDRHVQGRAHHRLHGHRAQPRYPPFRQPRPLRRLQRRRPHRVLFRAASCTASPGGATVNSTTPSTWPPFARSANPTPKAAPTSTARSPTAKPMKKRYAH